MARVRATRRLIPAFIILTVLFLISGPLPAAANSAPAAPTVVHPQTGGTGDPVIVTSVICIETSGNAPPNTGCTTGSTTIGSNEYLIAIATSGGKAKANTVTSTGDTFANATYCPFGTGADTQTVYTVASPATGSGKTFTLVNGANAVDTYLLVIVLQGESIAIDNVGTCTSATGTLASSSATASVANDLYIGTWIDSTVPNGAVCAGSSGSTILSNDPAGSAFQGWCQAYDYFTGSGANTIAVTEPASTTWGGFALAISGSALLTQTLTNNKHSTGIDAGQTVYVNFTIAHGITPYTWTLTKNGSASNLSGVTYAAGSGSYSTSALRPPASGATTYTFYLNTSDGYSLVDRNTTSVYVVPTMVIALSTNPATTQIGESERVHWTITGGDPPNTWTLTSSIHGTNYSGTTEQHPGTQAEQGNYTFTAASAATVTFYFNATDAFSFKAASTAVLTIDLAAVASVSAAHAYTEVGQTDTISFSIAHGVAPFTWTLTSSIHGTNYSGASWTSPSGSYGFVPAAVHQSPPVTFYFNITDAVGSGSKTTVSVNVNATLAAHLVDYPYSTIQVGASTDVNYSFTLGVPTVTWTLTSSIHGANYTGLSGPSGHYVFSPSATGTVTFYYNTTDGIGVVADATATVVVDAALVETISAAYATTQVGATDVITVSQSGGVPAIHWTLTANGSSSNITHVSGGHYNFPAYAIGTYTFYLNGTDAVGSTSKVTTTITVVAALAVTLSASPTTTQVGESSTLTLTISHGAPPVTWTLKSTIHGTNITGVSGGTYTFTPASSGTVTFYLNATDNVGSVSKATATVIVKVALSVSLSASPMTTEVGLSTTISLAIADGVAPVTWTLEYGLSPYNLTGVSHDLYAWSPLSTGTVTFYLNATDAVGSTAAATVVVTVVTALYVTLAAVPSSISLPATSDIDYAHGAGVAPITWTLTVNGSSTNLTGASGGTLVFTPGGAGVYTFYFNATDADGVKADAVASLYAAPITGSIFTSLTAGPGSIHVGNASILTVVILGGVGNVNWTLRVNGSSANISGVFGGQYSFTGPSVATYTFQLIATDAHSHYSESQATVTVLGAVPPPVAPSSFVFPWWDDFWLIFGVSLFFAMIGLAATRYWIRHKRVAYSTTAYQQRPRNGRQRAR